MSIENKIDRSDRQITTIRIFDAPQKIVFAAWANPDLLAQWWGPKGFTNTFQEFNLREGGHWKFIMHGPDGSKYNNESVFIEIKQSERIVLRHISKPHFQLTAHFEKIDENKTKLIFEQLFDTVEEYNKVKTFAVSANEENMDRLNEVLKDFQSVQSNHLPNQ